MSEKRNIYFPKDVIDNILKPHRKLWKAKGYHIVVRRAFAELYELREWKKRILKKHPHLISEDIENLMNAKYD